MIPVNILDQPTPSCGCGPCKLESAFDGFVELVDPIIQGISILDTENGSVEEFYLHHFKSRFTQHITDVKNVVMGSRFEGRVLPAEKCQEHLEEMATAVILAFNETSLVRDPHNPTSVLRTMRIKTKFDGFATTT